MRDTMHHAKGKDRLDQIRIDMQKLRELVEELSALEARTTDENITKHAVAMRDILRRMETGQLQYMSDKQRQYVHDLHDQHCGTPEYENLVSNGLVPVGKPVEKPDVLKKLPLRPPGAKNQAWKE